MFYSVFETPKGPMAFAWHKNNLRGVVLPFSSRKKLNQWIDLNWSDFKEEEPKKGAWTKKLQRDFCRYFEGTLRDFSWVSIETQGTSFQQKVYKQLRMVPAGTTVSYQELGERAGKERSGRAVGSLMSSNPMPLVIPCHRVLPASRKLGAFSADGGANMKKWMLELEGAIID